MKTIIQFASLKAGFVRLTLLLVIIILFFGFAGLHAQRTLPTTDQFDYDTGPLQIVGLDWTRTSGSGNDLVVTDGNITYNGYLGANGRRATMTNGANDDLKLSFTGQSTFGTTVYCAFVLNVQNITGLSATGVYCFILGFGVTNFAARIYIKYSDAGYQLGISKTATVPSLWSAILNINTPKLVVMSYQILPGNSTDVASLWIDPVITTIPPPANLTTTYGVDFGSASSMDSFFLRQTPGSPNASVDDISISTDWVELFKNPVYTVSGSIGEGSFNDLTVTGSATSLALAGNISINGTLSLEDATIIPAGNTLIYGTNGVLDYSGTASQTATDNEFPALNGPQVLKIDNTAGVILNLDRILNGNLTITNGSKLIIKPLTTLTVQGNTNLNSAESLVIKSDATGTGSFIDNGVINGAGIAIVERYLTGYTSIDDVKYHFISSPVEIQPIQPGFVTDPPNTGDDFYKWDEPYAIWINTKNSSGSWNTGFESAFEPAKGYLVSYPSDLTRNFAGNLNTNLPGSPMTINCSWTDPVSGGGGGWNLLGNPYPSAIDWTLVTRGSGIDNALYYYDASVENYRYYIQFQPGFALGNGSQYIPAMQGFMVHANNSGDHSINIDNTCRVHQSMNICYKNSISMKNVLKLKVEKEGRIDELFILLRNEANPEFDVSSDAYKLFSLNPAVPQIYSITPENLELAVNTIPAIKGDLIVPIGLKTGSCGTFIMTADETNSFDPGTTIVLEDLKTGVNQNLMANPVYLFTASSTDDPERFYLHFSDISGINGQTQQSGIRIYSNNHLIYIVSEQTFQNGKVILYDLSGQDLFHRDLDGAGLVSFHTDVNPGLYLVKVINDGNVQVEKVIIQ
jgi:hypothetical protein